MSNTNDNIPVGWKETTLGEIMESKGYIRGPFGSALKRGEMQDSGIPVYEQKNAIYNERSFRYFINQEKFESLKRFQVKTGDLIISCSGTVGRISIIKEDDPKGIISQALLILRVDRQKVLLKYLFYFLTSRRGFYEITNASHGSVQANIAPRNVVEGITLNLPPLPKQKAIASILTAFDAKIENLQAQNKTLEQTAQTIFKEWFGKYQIDDKLPEGWRVGKLGEIVDTVNGYSYKGKELVSESNSALVTLKSFDRNGGFQTRGFKPFHGNPKENQEVKIGNLVVAHTDLTQDAEVLGNPAFIFDNGGFEKMYITMDLVKVISKNEIFSSSFLYYLMKDRRFKGHCVGYSNGTTVLHLSKKAIPEYEIPLPNTFDEIVRFSKIADTTTTKISLNKEQIQTLKKTRDTLLPKLMSGQLRVKT